MAGEERKVELRQAGLHLARAQPQPFQRRLDPPRVGVVAEEVGFEADESADLSGKDGVEQLIDIGLAAAG